MKEVEDANVVNDNMRPEVQTYFDIYSMSPTHNNCFYGDKHSRAELMNNSGSISVDRQGGMTITILSMLLEKENGKAKYTLDQLLDPNQLQKEKQDRFDEIVNRSRKTADDKEKTMAESEDGKWLVETLYNGMKRLNEIIDETAEKIDFTKDNFIYSKEFARVAGLSTIAFDAWQEINRFEKMMHEAVLADRPELTTEESRRKHIDNMVNPLSTTYQYMQKSFDYHNQAENGDINVTSYICNALHVKYVEKIMRDWKNSGTKLSQYMADNNIAHKMDRNRAVADSNMFDMSLKFIEIPDIGAVADRRIQDGSLLKNVEYDDVTETFSNFPKLKDDNSDFIIEEKRQIVFPEEKREKNTEKKTAKKTEKKAEKPTAKKKEKMSGPTIETRSGESIPVDEVIDYLQALKQTAGEARGLFHDSNEYTKFYMAIDDVMKAARNLKKSKNIINDDGDRLKDYKEAVNRLKDCAETYEVYKMSDHTRDKSKEPDKKALNSDDKRKLKIMRGVLQNNRYFNVDTPKLTNEDFLAKTDRALFRLKQGDYKNKQRYIEDSAYAVFGQMYRVSGNMDKSINLQQIMQEKMASGEFEKNLISKKNPTKYISPAEVAKMAQNEGKMREMANTVKKEKADNNIIHDVPKKGTSPQKGNDISPNRVMH